MSQLKRKMNWLTPMVDFNEVQPPNPKRRTMTQTFSEPSRRDVNLTPDLTPLSISSPLKANSLPRIEKTSNLIVNPKKVDEVRQWLILYEHRQTASCILFLNGPSGCGKLSTVKVIAAELYYKVIEYLTVDQTDDLVEETGENQIEQLSRFLATATRYNEVIGGGDSTFKKKLIVVKDIPNGLLREPEALNDILDNYQRLSRCPLLFIITECGSKDARLFQNLFNDDLLEKFHIAKIHFNPIPITTMIKALKELCTRFKESKFRDGYYIPSQNVIDSVAITSQGDIRNAILNLQFVCQKGQVSLPTEQFSQDITTKLSAKRFKSMGMDSIVPIMHTLGKIFNPKYETREEGLPQMKNNPELLTDYYSSQPSRFLSLMHANFISRFSRIDDLSRACDIICRADNLINDWKSETSVELGLNIAIRGVMVLNQRPVGGFYKVKSTNKKRFKYSNNWNVDTYLKLIKESKRNDCKDSKILAEQDFIIEDD